MDKSRLKPKARGWRRTVERWVGANPMRIAVQSAFLALIVWIGWGFWRFVEHHERLLPGEAPARPPGVEGFLPISGLMGVRDWVHTGRLNDIHPAATVLVIIFLLISWLLRKSFCSWICPVGALSEYLWKLGRFFFRRNSPPPPRWLDIPLRGLKYLLLGFFLYAIYWTMDVTAVRLFIESPYNRVSDVKMLEFFQSISPFALKTIVVLSLFSLLIRNFWCRYLCPYGALLGLFSRLSPTAVRRVPESCIDCGKCALACPSYLPVDKLLTVRSTECTGCLDCVAVCPVRDTLDARAARRRWSIPGFAAAVVLMFLIGVGLARLTGHWQSSISGDEYRRRIQEMDSPLYSHPGR